MSDKAWTESDRPKDFEEYFGHEEEVESIKKKLKAGSKKPILLYGPPGTGKTTIARIIARYKHGENWEDYLLDLNASDENGIDVIRTKVKNRAKAMTITGDSQIIFLDECEALTGPAQEALRRTMEDYESNCLFILATNDLSGIIAPIQSRCKGSTYSIDLLQSTEMQQLIDHISALKDLDIPGQKRAEMILQADGDARAMVNILQAYDEGSYIDEDYSYEDRHTKLVNILKDGIDDPLLLIPLIRENELDVFAYKVMKDTDTDMEVRSELMKIIAETDFRIQRSHNKDVHLIQMFLDMEEEWI